MIKYNPSITLIKSKNKNKPQLFRFRETNIDEMIKSIKNLDPKKESQKSDMNKNILRKNAALLQNTPALTSMPQFSPKTFTIN